MLSDDFIFNNDRLEKVANSITENISEIQFTNSLIYGRINSCLENNQDPKIYIESLKELLSLQEKLTRLSMEIDTYMELNDPFVEDYDFPDED